MTRSIWLLATLPVLIGWGGSTTAWAQQANMQRPQSVQVAQSSGGNPPSCPMGGTQGQEQGQGQQGQPPQGQQGQQGQGQRPQGQPPQGQQGQGQGQGQRPQGQPPQGQQGQGQGQGQRPQGQRPAPPDFAAAAAQLGVTEAALKEALGVPAEPPAEPPTMQNGECPSGPPPPPDFAAAAQQLGVTEAELKAALGVPAQPPGNGQGPNAQGGQTSNQSGRQRPAQ